MKNIKLPEIVAVGVFDATTYFAPRKITKNRRTSMFEIEIPLEAGGFSVIDEQKTKIEPDLIICAKPGQVRHTELPFRCYFVHLMVDEGFVFDTLNRLPNHFSTSRPEKYIKVFEDMYKFFESGVESDLLMLQSLVIKLIYMIDRETEKFFDKKAKKGERDSLMEQAIRFIDENFTSKICLEDIAAHVSLSPIHFHHRFRNATGKTPHDYVLDKRIKKAENMLVTTSMSVSQIAYECGFSSQAYFTYSFKKHKGMSPREYMKKVYERYSEEE